MANQDKLTMLKSSYLSEISKKESELKVLREKLAFVELLDSDADKLTPATNGQLKFAGGKKQQLIDVVLESLKTVGSNGISASKLAKYIKDNGFPVKGNNFNISVGTSLRRLAERGEIESKLVDSKRLFSPVNTEEFK